MKENTASSQLIRVLVVDDSAFMRTAISRMIESDPGLRVLSTAQTGAEALEKVISLRPDLVTLDVEMPGMNGIETLKRIMEQSPRPVIMVSSLTQEGAETTLEALSLGAFDYVPKQQSYVSLDIIKIREDLVSKIKAAVESFRRKPLLKTPKVTTAPPPSAAPQRQAYHVPPALSPSALPPADPKPCRKFFLYSQPICRWECSSCSICRKDSLVLLRAASTRYAKSRYAKPATTTPSSRGSYMLGPRAST